MDLSTFSSFSAGELQSVDPGQELIELASPACRKTTDTPAVASFDESHIVRGYD